MLPTLPKLHSMNLIKESAKKKWWLPFFSTIIIFLAPQLLLGIWLGVFLAIYVGVTGNINLFDNFTDYSQTTVLSLFSFAIPAITLLIIFKFFNKQPLAALGFVKKNLALKYVSGLLMGGIALVLVLGVCLLAGSASITLSTTTSWPMVALLFVGFMVQGMTEELFFRGYLMNLVGHRKNVAVTIIGNSILFGLFHGANPNMSVISLINLMLFGLIFSLLFYLTENLWLVGAAHTIWNFMMGPIFGIEVSGQNFGSGAAVFNTSLADNSAWLNGGSFGLEGGLACTLVGMIAIGALVYLIKKKLEN